jgi:hypothetical protein
LSPEAQSLLKGLFKLKPKERLGWLHDGEEIKKHPFFANVDFNQILKQEVEAPISFKEALNDEGFDIDFEGSYQSTVNLDRSVTNKGLIFDGFTYYKPEVSPPCKDMEHSKPYSVHDLQTERQETEKEAGNETEKQSLEK